MRPVTIKQTGVGESTPFITDYYLSPFNIGFGVVPEAGSIFTVQYTFDGTNWFDHPDITASNVAAAGNFAFPVLQVRVQVNAGTGATMTIIQAGLSR